MSWTKRKFLSLPLVTQHRQAAKALRLAWESRDIALYRQCEEFLGLPQVDEKDLRSLSDRYHIHLKLAGLSLKEHNLLPQVQKGDAPSDESFLPIAIYLDGLRSAYNVGNILRTTEALRLGSVYFSPATPFTDNPKVQKTSMHTYDKVPCKRITTLNELPRPLIALETVEGAPSVFDFDFPETFTLLLGNEEYGLSKEALSMADHFVRIPLFGSKNSLNVAAAFAITAAFIRCQEIASPLK